ncbi:hypothetical protein [Streptomyces sp. W007]|uniref:hypothetical protein n=1 Tax=Streptomyces sp. W007 TaxID=1055352 RepID=UPI0002E4080D|nr:hypothetical protein [Streptomyces sp. W007]
MSADPHGLKTRAVAFAVRAGHTDDMAHRFLERLCAAGKLGLVSEFGPLLSEMMREDHS